MHVLCLGRRLLLCACVVLGEEVVAVYLCVCACVVLGEEVVAVCMCCA